MQQCYFTWSGLGGSLGAECISVIYWGTGTWSYVCETGILLAVSGHSLSPSLAKLRVTGSLGGALALCKVGGLGGFLLRTHLKTGLQNTAGSSGECAALLESSTKEIISVPYCIRLSLRTQNSLQLFIAMN